MTGTDAVGVTFRFTRNGMHIAKRIHYLVVRHSNFSEMIETIFDELVQSDTINKK